jgi:hypothetical protein
MVITIPNINYNIVYICITKNVAIKLHKYMLN